jgi:sialate O-acetylesterase
MVLQQGMPVPVWGTAAPGETVTVSFAGQTVRTTADAQGAWRVALKKLSVDSTPHELTIAGTNTLTYKNVLVGEVWLCSGQSNMEMAVKSVRDAQEEIAAANYPMIRMFTVPSKAAATPQARCGGAWAVCSPATVPAFSAAGYFFARKLATDLKVPVGMIHSSVGGTPAEAWTSAATLRTLPYFVKPVADLEQRVREADLPPAEFARRRDEALQRHWGDIQSWWAQLNTMDPGIKGQFAAPATNTASWPTLTCPSHYGTPNVLGNFSGVIWLRKEVEIPQAWVGQALTLRLGAVDEVDDTFVNGVKIGHTGFDAPNFWKVKRVYAIPAAQVTSTRVVIAVQALNAFGEAGLYGPAEEMQLTREGDTQAVSLAGDWRYNQSLGVDIQTMPRAPLTALPGKSAADVSSLYNGMIAPLIPYAIRGALWYQGEANAGMPNLYRDLFPAMIRDWRQAWGQGDFFFDFVQLANFQARQTQPSEWASWADVREAQGQALRLPHTAMAVIIDIGDAQNIHPRNKQDVGLRLALPALAKVYHQPVAVYAGPMYRSMRVKNQTVRLRFANADGLLAKGGPPVGFVVAGTDKIFHVAQAKIERDTVVVWSDKVAHPVAVRYAWASNPVCNLFNAAGLPASPFRTDAWGLFDARSAAGEVMPVQ